MKSALPVFLLVLLLTFALWNGRPAVHAAEGSAAATGQTSGSREEGPFDLRGFGKVSAEGRIVTTDQGPVSVVHFKTESTKYATILASKYVTDLQAYGLVTEVVSPDFSPAAAFTVKDGGAWLVGEKGADVFVLSGASFDALKSTATGLQSAQWTKPESHDYPRYLDFFDNDSLGQWWMPPTKKPEIMDFFKNHPAIINAHTETFSASYAPHVYDYSGAANVVAQANEIDKPFRLMFWEGIARWWDRDGKQQTEEPPHGALLRGLFDSGGYYETQTAMPDANTIQLNTMAHFMEAFRDNPSLLGWLEPHGEFNLQAVPNELPDAPARFIKFLKETRGYSLADANQAYGFHAASWGQIVLPEEAYFYGRRGHYLDLDEQPWRWQPAASDTDGQQKNWFAPTFDDSAWPQDPRWGKRMLSQIPARGTKTCPLWYRFTSDVPATFLKDSPKWMVHIMPFSEGAGRAVSLWVNGQEAKADTVKGLTDSYNDHVQFDVTSLLQPGKNQFAIFVDGGRIRYRVWISDVSAEPFPFADPKLSQLWLDWNDYFISEKFNNLDTYLRWMRTVDPIHPIKIMTPFMFQSRALDLCEKYGAYPQLTGEGPGFYRPMHYKGYARLRHLPGSSEPGGPVKDAREAQGMFSNIFWESQDCHDYVFDPQRDMWPYPEVVKWWKDHIPLLKTLGKVDFPAAQVGELRDLDQTNRFGNGEIWHWDLARGPLPSAGETPVLIDGRDFDLGLADKIPVVFDDATLVMTPERVKAIEHYVEEGGTFVAQHNTGRHDVMARDTWPLARAFGLKIEDRVPAGQTAQNAPTTTITFMPDEDLMPSLRGKKTEGAGISIDYLGTQEVGAVTIKSDSSDVKPIAKWDDGTMAVCEVHRGKGRIVWLGSPFYLRFKDESGKWMNDDDRQALFDEMLTGLGVVRSATSTDPRVWIERRESKNGLYDVYIASAMNIRDKNWKLEEPITTDLFLRAPAHGLVFDPTLDGSPEVVTAPADGGVKLQAQAFQPYQVRQFAVVRQDAGLEGPLHWLEVQQGAWRATEDPQIGSLDELEKAYDKVVAKSHEDGLDFSTAWKVRLSSDPTANADTDWTKPGYDDSSWKNGNVGTWLVEGWKDTQLVQYRKTLDLPAAWVSPKKRVLLGFRGFFSLGIHDSGELWINGKPMEAPMSNGMLIDVTDAAQSGKLAVAMQVAAAPTQLNAGAGGVFYLRSIDKPVETLDLGGAWDKRDSWESINGTTTLPGQVTDTFGLRKVVQLPPGWQGKPIHLVIDQGKVPFVSGLFVNDEGFMYKEPYEYGLNGVRIDRWLKPGENRIEIYGNGFMSAAEYKKMNGEVVSIRLERYN